MGGSREGADSIGQRISILNFLGYAIPDMPIQVRLKRNVRFVDRTKTNLAFMKIWPWLSQSRWRCLHTLRVVACIFSVLIVGIRTSKGDELFWVITSGMYSIEKYFESLSLICPFRVISFMRLSLSLWNNLHEANRKRVLMRSIYFARGVNEAYFWECFHVIDGWSESLNP